MLVKSEDGDVAHVRSAGISHVTSEARESNWKIDSASSCRNLYSLFHKSVILQDDSTIICLANKG